MEIAGASDKPKSTNKELRDGDVAGSGKTNGEGSDEKVHVHSGDGRQRLFIQLLCEKRGLQYQPSNLHCQSHHLSFPSTQGAVLFPSFLLFTLLFSPLYHFRY